MMRKVISRSISSRKVLACLCPNPRPSEKSAATTLPIPMVHTYPLEYGMSMPSPSAIDFTPGDLLNCVHGALGLRDFLKDTKDHRLIVTHHRDGSQFLKQLEVANILVISPCYPVYLTSDLLRTHAPNLELIITAGVGSDHIDLLAASKLKIDVAETTLANSVSEAEFQVLEILSLVKNYLPAVAAVTAATSSGQSELDIAGLSSRSYDLEGMRFGSIGAGRVGQAVLQRLKPFGVSLHYHDHRQMPQADEKALGVTYWKKWEEMIRSMDIVALNCPLHSGTVGMIDEKSLKLFKRGALLVSARGKLCDAAAIREALESGELGGFAGMDDNTWVPELENMPHTGAEAAAEHTTEAEAAAAATAETVAAAVAKAKLKWRSMPRSSITPNLSGNSLAAQARIAAGVREILECYIGGRPIRKEYMVLSNGRLTGLGSRALGGPGPAPKTDAGAGTDVREDDDADFDKGERYHDWIGTDIGG